MSNIFIKETKNFYNYIASTHCKDFKDEFNKYYDMNITYYLDFFNTKKKKTQSLYNLYNVLRNNEFIKIRNYIFKECSEEEKFEEWMKVLKNFGDFVFNFSDPLFISPEDGGIIVNKTDNVNSLVIKHKLFEFAINFERSKIKKSNSSSLFDSITGLDKENNLSFINIKITNTMSGTVYKYNYVEDSALNPENPIPEDICDLQLEYIKQKLDKYIYDYIGIIFDTIVNNELRTVHFNIFNSVYIRNNFKEIEEEWLKTMNMESN